MKTNFFRALFENKPHPVSLTDDKLGLIKTKPLASHQPSLSETVSAITNTAPQTISNTNPDIHQEQTHPASQCCRLKADAFLEEALEGLDATMEQLLRLEILVQQDIHDLNTGMYGAEHIGDYRALIAQQLQLRAL